MKHLNAITYIIFAGMLLVFWGLNKAQIAFDHQKYFIVLLFVLFLLAILRFVARMKRGTSVDPYERTTPDAFGKEKNDAVELDLERKDEIRGSKAKGKRLILAILVFVIFIGFRIARRELISNVLLDGFDTTEELFADIDRRQEFRAAWDEYRKEEMANGGPTYLVEDIFAETRKPDHWKEFFVLTYVPAGFYYKDSGIQFKSPGNWTFTEIFYDFPTETQFVYFVQSADYDYNDAHVPDGIKKEEGKLYKEEKGNRNQIIWFHGDLTLYVEGNISMDELEKIASQAVNYDELQYDYSAIEDVAGKYE